MLCVTSTLPAYLRLRSVSAAAERERAWTDHYEAAHPELFELYYAGYGDRGDRGRAAAQVPEMAQELERREVRVRHALDRAVTDLLDCGLMQPGGVINAALIVGTGHSDGWVAVLDGRPTVFLALEMLPEPGRDEVLIIHELIHALHLRTQWPAFVERPGLEHQVGFRVWAEGLAVAATRMLRPGRPDCAYLFVSDPAWFDRCRATLAEIAATLLPNAEATDAAIAYSLCGVTDDHPWPSRAGYWIGEQVVGELLEAGHDLSELLAWEPEQVGAALRASRLLSPT